jgi:hypothetical protein
MSDWIYCKFCEERTISTTGICLSCQNKYKHMPDHQPADQQPIYIKCNEPVCLWKCNKGICHHYYVFKTLYDDCHNYSIINSQPDFTKKVGD